MSCTALSKSLRSSPQPQASPAESQESSWASSGDLYEDGAQAAGLDRLDSAFRGEGPSQEAAEALASLPCCGDVPDGDAAKSPFSSWDLEADPVEVSAQEANESAARGRSQPRAMRTADSVPQGPRGGATAITVSADPAALEPRLITKSLSADTDALLQHGQTLREHLRAALVRHHASFASLQATGMVHATASEKGAGVCQTQAQGRIAP